MQTLHQEIDPAPQGLTAHDESVLNALSADQAAAYAHEVAALRKRVVELESELASAKAATVTAAPAARPTPPLTSIDLAPARPHPVTTPAPAAAAEPVSEFTESLQPAVVAVEATSAPVSNPGFAQAWNNDVEESFEERLAEKAFFEASAVDEASRSWLLDQ